jgi:hypothetical protein
MGYQFALDVSDFSWYSRHDGMQLPQIGACFEPASHAELAALLGWRHWSWARRLRLYRASPSAKTVLEPHYQFSERCFNGTDATYYVGYWQSPRYFENVAPQLRTELGLTDEQLAPHYGELLPLIRSTNSVAVHVRRGDFVSNWRGRRVHASCDRHYYAAAIARIRQSVSSPIFFVFSDDPQAVIDLQLVPEPFVIVNVYPRPPAFVELTMMSRCKYFVIANSTFSWWAAWLGTCSDKIVVAPSRWIQSATQNTSDLLPDTWHIIR